jgi:hypothetical protein
VALFLEARIKASKTATVLLRVEGFNLLNHGNYLGRGQTVYGNAETPAPTFGQLVSAGAATTALPAFASVDPPRMFQFQARFIF